MTHTNGRRARNYFSENFAIPTLNVFATISHPNPFFPILYLNIVCIVIVSKKAFENTIEKNDKINKRTFNLEVQHPEKQRLRMGSKSRDIYAVWS
jgi:hypothetical protein